MGAIVAAGILGLALAALESGHLVSIGGQPSYALRARFANVGGLKVHASVRDAGVSIGQVTAISLDNDTHQGLVELEIRDGIAFPIDSTARILTSGLLGDQYIGIEPGAGTASLKAGDMIEQTRSAIVFESLLDQLITPRAAPSPSLPRSSTASASAR